MRISDWSSDVCSSDLSEPYRIKNGAWILSRDWEKVGRYYQGKQRRLPPFEYSVTRTIDDLFAARDWLLQSRLIATDVETACHPAQITCNGYTGIHPSGQVRRSEEHTSELQSLMRISYAVFCLKKKNERHTIKTQHTHHATHLYSNI